MARLTIERDGKELAGLEFPDAAITALYAVFSAETDEAVALAYLELQAIGLRATLEGLHVGKAEVAARDDFAGKVWPKEAAEALEGKKADG